MARALRFRVGCLVLCAAWGSFVPGLEGTLVGRGEGWLVGAEVGRTEVLAVEPSEGGAGKDSGGALGAASLLERGGDCCACTVRPWSGGLGPSGETASP